MKRIVFILIITLLLINRVASQITWTGGAGDFLWSTPANWTGNMVPGSNDDVIFNGTTVIVDMDNLTSATPYVINSLLITNGANITLRKNESATSTRILQVKSISTITKGLQIDAGSLLKIHGINSTGTFDFILDFGSNPAVTGEISGELQFSGVGSTGTQNDTRLRLYTDAFNNANLVVKSGGIIRYLPLTGSTTSFASGGPYFTMDSASSYILERDGGAFPQGGLWNPNSLAKVENLLGSNAASFLGNNYGDLDWNSTVLTAPIAPLFLNATPSFNNVNIISTKGFPIIIRNSNGPREITINGDLTISADSKIELTSSLVTSGGGKIKLKGNLTNSGTITSSGLTGTSNDFILNGSTQQSIMCAGSVTGTLKLTMNNASGAILLSNLTIPDSLALLNGIISTKADSLLTMVNDAGYSGGSVNSFINGPMKKIGDDDFIFPVGSSSNGINGIFAPIGITNGVNQSITDGFTAEYKRLSPQNVFGIDYTGTTINHVSYIEYWTLERDDLSTATKFISLNVHPTSFCTDETTTFVSQFNGTSWTQEASTGNGFFTCNNPYRCGTLTTNNLMSDFTLVPSIFTLATTDDFATNPLPIRLIDFNAVKISNSQALLNWELAEKVSKHVQFELEKSTDNRIFNVLATISGSETNRYYAYNDTRLGKGISWYRLKMTDVDGSVTFSKVVAVVNDVKGFVITGIAPNPVHNAATISLHAAFPESVSFTVYDISGNIVKQWQSAISAGINTVNMQVAGLARGTYHVQVYSASSKQSFRFIKQ